VVTVVAPYISFQCPLLHFFLWCSAHASKPPISALEADPILDDVPLTILVDTRTVTRRGSEPASSDNDSGLSNSNPDPIATMTVVLVKMSRSV
jgi:hypothetical protein